MVDAVDSKFIILGFVGSSPTTSTNEGSLVGRTLYCDHKNMGSIPILHLYILFSLIGIALVFDIKGCGFESYKRQKFGLVAEWFNALVLKTKDFGPWVRIPPSPFAC
jgi:hypothetical protein